MGESFVTQVLDTPTAVVAALGGNGAVARIASSNARAVTNWKKRGFPPRTFPALTEALRRRGLHAPMRLWGMVEVAETEAAE